MSVSVSVSVSVSTLGWVLVKFSLRISIFPPESNESCYKWPNWSQTGWEGFDQAKYLGTLIEKLRQQLGR